MSPIAASTPAFRFAPLRPTDPGRAGRHVLRARLGVGGMSKVYLAFTATGRPLAVKVLDPQWRQDARVAGCFAREALALQAIEGGHVARLIDADPQAPRPWLATEYVAGPSLEDLVTETGPLPAADALLVAHGIARALISIHRADVVHRDLKPANVILDEAGPKVIDFGIVQRGGREPAATGGEGLRIGTLPFMSPEQALGRRVAASSDVFSLGSTLYFLATGRTPFEAGYAPSTLYRIVHERPSVAGLDDRVARVVTACLAKDPAQRPAPADVAELCREATGPVPPGAHLDIAGAAAPIRERAAALHALNDFGAARPRRRPRRHPRRGPIGSARFISAARAVSTWPTIPHAVALPAPQPGPHPKD